jgi:transcriptional regulator with XRE-family HTH domain
MTNKEKFLNLVSNEKSNTLQNLKERKKNRAVLRESQSIAFKVVQRLDTLKWTQKKLAENLDVSPQQVTKIISGKENLTLETLVKLQTVLEIPLLVTSIEKIFDEMMQSHKVEVSQDYKVPEKVTISIQPNNPSVVKFTAKQETTTYENFKTAM